MGLECPIVVLRIRFRVFPCSSQKVLRAMPHTLFFAMVLSFGLFLVADGLHIASVSRSDHEHASYKSVALRKTMFITYSMDFDGQQCIDMLYALAPGNSKHIGSKQQSLSTHIIFSRTTIAQGKSILFHIWPVWPSRSMGFETPLKTNWSEYSKDATPIPRPTCSWAKQSLNNADHNLKSTSF